VKIHDKYILEKFWKNLALGLIAFSIIFIIVNISEEIDNYIDHDATFNEIASYYLNLVPWILTLIMPVSVLLSVVFSLGKMSRDNELTAFIASGLSLFRISFPILISSIFISIFMIVFSETVTPITYRKSERIMTVEIEEKKPANYHMVKENLHYLGAHNRIYYADKYNTKVKQLTNVIIHKYKGSKLIRRIDAKKGYWDGEKWILLNGVIREFKQNGEKITKFKELPMKQLPEKPEDLAKTQVEPGEMNYTELKNYINKIRRGGGSVDKYLVDLYFKLSFPFTNFIFALIGIAFSSAKRKPSMATGFGLTLIISFSYYGILRIGQSLGHSGVLHPLLGAWMVNILFLIAGGFLLYRANR
jgi:lipopolysaccharide export system permease protein